ncbi:MAG TPA: class I SAM-dependent methyltransferase [Solirubrobacteraceae bacterium]|nr:class I SAM-dependent methyltransferase [Solirubrobacteraceae bacterium]
MARMKTQVTQELADYVARHARQDEVLARVERETNELPRAMMATTPDEAAFLTMLARLVGARNALEIGTFTGYGAISIARGLAEGGSLTCLEVSDEYAEIARRNIESAGLGDRVEIKVGPADEALRAMPEEPTFDDVFIDADKTGYPTYYDLVIPRLVSGGLLLLDNVFLGGDVVSPSDERTRTMDDLNNRVTADERVDSVMIFVADGVTLVRKR